MAVRDAAREWGPSAQVRQTLQVDVQDKLAQSISDPSFSATWRLIPTPDSLMPSELSTSGIEPAAEPPAEGAPEGAPEPEPEPEQAVEPAATPQPEPEPEPEPAGGARSPSPERKDATQWFASAAGPSSWAGAGGRKPGSAGRARASGKKAGIPKPEGTLEDVLTTAHTGKFRRPQTPVRIATTFGGSFWLLCGHFEGSLDSILVNSGCVVGRHDRAQPPEAAATAATAAGRAAR